MSTRPSIPRSQPLQYANRDISVDLCNDSNVDIKIELDMNLQTALDISFLMNSFLVVLLIFLTSAGVSFWLSMDRSAQCRKWAKSAAAYAIFESLESRLGVGSLFGSLLTVFAKVFAQ
jgi:hypothetical protein